MATLTQIKKVLQIIVEKDNDGNTAKFSLSKLNQSATAEQLLAAAEGIAELQTRTVKNYRIQDLQELTE